MKGRGGGKGRREEGERKGRGMEEGNGERRKRYEERKGISRTGGWGGGSDEIFCF